MNIDSVTSFQIINKNVRKWWDSYVPCRAMAKKDTFNKVALGNLKRWRIYTSFSTKHQRLIITFALKAGTLFPNGDSFWGVKQ